MKVPAEQPHSIAEGLQLNGNARAMNGVGGIAGPEARVKLEEKIDERQLSRLATGVTVDTGITAPTPVSQHAPWSLCMSAET
jgi:histone acetyltransferase